MAEPINMAAWRKGAKWLAEVAIEGTVAGAQAERVVRLCDAIEQKDAALRAVEWIETDESPGVSELFCPECWNQKWRGHRRGCRLAAALATTKGGQ